MVLRVCRGCTALFPPGLARCPQCDADDHYEQGSEAEEMPKISKEQGPTYSDEFVDAADEQGEALPGLVPGTVEEARADRPFKPAEPADDDSGAYVQEPDYSEWSYSELQAECKERGLTATGSQQVLCERLAEDDRTRGSSSG